MDGSKAILLRSHEGWQKREEEAFDRACKGIGKVAYHLAIFTFFALSFGVPEAFICDCVVYACAGVLATGHMSSHNLYCIRTEVMNSVGVL